MSTLLPAIALRGGGPGDMGLVGAIMGEAFDPRYGEAWTSAQCLGILTLPGVWLSLATLDGAPAGFALARATLDEAELLLLATRPAARRCGVGVQLLRSVAAESVRRGAITLHLEVRAGNEAIYLYENEGFTKVGQRRDYYRGKDGSVYDAHSFSRTLV